jgi:signal peptidase I
MQKGQRRTNRIRVISRTFGWVFVLALVATPSILHSQIGLGISPILSSSMSPAAEPGDAFITINKPASTLKVGDIVTLKEAESGAFFAHRIIEIREQSGLLRIVTKGDSNQLSEEDPYMVSGLVEVPMTVLRVKYIGYALAYLTSLQGKQFALTLIVLANLMVLILFLFRKKIVIGISKAEAVFRSLYADSLLTHHKEVQRSDTYKDLYEQTRRELQELKES